MDNNTVGGSRINLAAGDDEGTWLHAWGLITSFVVSMTLKVAMELGIFDALSNAGSGAITADELAQLGAAAGGGQTAFKRTHGVPMGKHLGRSPRLVGVVDKAMVQISVMVTSKLLERFHGFDDMVVLIDVGGSTGSTLEMITSKYKHIRGIYFAQPHVISLAPSIPGVEHIAGNMLDNVPAGDAIFLKLYIYELLFQNFHQGWDEPTHADCGFSCATTVLHILDDNDCIKVLKNCHQALSDKGRLIAVEFILDVMMLNNSEGGKERTEQEFIKLARESGFSGTFQSTCIFGNFWALKFTK
ncbi:hypothetical protein VPH35_005997 [Triticum aestivum]